jgi:hypothetical protein
MLINQWRPVGDGTTNCQQPIVLKLNSTTRFSAVLHRDTIMLHTGLEQVKFVASGRALFRRGFRPIDVYTGCEKPLILFTTELA